MPFLRLVRSEWKGDHWSNGRPSLFTSEEHDVAERDEDFRNGEQRERIREKRPSAVMTEGGGQTLSETKEESGKRSNNKQQFYSYAGD